MFFRPQFLRNRTPASPRLYEKLLATCYDTLHLLRGRDVNVITSVSPRGNDNPRAISNVSLSPVTFTRELGRAYRASHRRKPIFDTWGQNVYGASSSEPVSKRHVGGTISQGDYGRENVSVLSSPAQAQQLSAAIKLAYCQPAVEALFNFELADDPALSGWQSGLLWADWTPKPSYELVRDVALSANAGTLGCG